MSTTYHRFLTDEQWVLIEPHLPPQPAVGRKRADDRRTLNAILFVLRTGIQWNNLPKELGDDSTAHRRLKQWQANGTFERLWRAFLSTLDKEGRLDWAEAFLDGTFIPAKGGAPK